MNMPDIKFDQHSDEVVLSTSKSTETYNDVTEALKADELSEGNSFQPLSSSESQGDFQSTAATSNENIVFQVTKFQK